MTVLMRVVCLGVIGFGAYVAYSLVRYGNLHADIDRALNSPRDGEPRRVVCPVHGHLVTVYTARDERLELETHHLVAHEQVQR